MVFRTIAQGRGAPSLFACKPIYAALLTPIPNRNQQYPHYPALKNCNSMHALRCLAQACWQHLDLCCCRMFRRHIWEATKYSASESSYT